MGFTKQVNSSMYIKCTQHNAMGEQESRVVVVLSRRFEYLGIARVCTKLYRTFELIHCSVTTGRGFEIQKYCEGSSARTGGMYVFNVAQHYYVSQ